MILLNAFFIIVILIWAYSKWGKNLFPEKIKPLEGHLKPNSIYTGGWTNVQTCSECGLIGLHKQMFLGLNPCRRCGYKHKHADGSREKSAKWDGEKWVFYEKIQGG